MKIEADQIKTFSINTTNSSSTISSPNFVSGSTGWIIGNTTTDHISWNIDNAYANYEPEYKRAYTTGRIEHWYKEPAIDANIVKRGIKCDCEGCAPE